MEPLETNVLDAESILSYHDSPGKQISVPKKASSPSIIVMPDEVVRV
jgi:hypothetical protein